MSQKKADSENPCTEYAFTIQRGDTCKVIYAIVAQELGTSHWKACPQGNAPVFKCDDLQPGASYIAVPLDCDCPAAAPGPANIFGAVTPRGDRAPGGAGQWESERTDEGFYRVTLEGYSGGQPTVVATAESSHDDDGTSSRNNIIATSNASVTGFDVSSYNVSQSDSNTFQDAGFSFTVLGLQST